MSKRKHVKTELKVSVSSKKKVDALFLVTLITVPLLIFVVIFAIFSVYFLNTRNKQILNKDAEAALLQKSTLKSTETPAPTATDLPTVTPTFTNTPTPTFTPSPRPTITSTPIRTVGGINLQILMFHHIRDFYDPKDPIGVGLSVSPVNFEKDLIAIQKKGYQTITFSDLENNFYNGKALPKKPILLSFDDGYDDVYTMAFPLLKKYNMHGSFSIITGAVGGLGSLTWSQIKEMKSAGNEITSHTVHHPDLSRQTAQTVTTELKNAKAILDQELGQNTTCLVYPSGKYTNQVIDIAKSLGYKIARTTTYGTSVSKDRVFVLPTVRMTNNSSVS